MTKCSTTRVKPERNEALRQWFQRVRQDFGQKTGSEVIKAFLEDCGGRRIRVPDLYDLYRMDRDRIIYNKFTGANYTELALNFNLSTGSIRRIVSRGRTARGKR